MLFDPALHTVGFTCLVIRFWNSDTFVFCKRGLSYSKRGFCNPFAFIPYRHFIFDRDWDMQFYQKYFRFSQVSDSYVVYKFYGKIVYSVNKCNKCSLFKILILDSNMFKPKDA